MGLGFRVNITPASGAGRLHAPHGARHQHGRRSHTGRTQLEELLRNHQFGDAGFSLLSQGTPTNNTEDAESGQSELEDADEAFDRYFPDTPPDDPTDPRQKRDGRAAGRVPRHRPAGLGAAHRRELLRPRSNRSRSDAHGTLECHARFLSRKHDAAGAPGQREMVRMHLINHVKGRGGIPAIRIGKQPYGILAISNLKNLEWLRRSQRHASCAGGDGAWALQRVEGDAGRLADAGAAVGARRQERRRARDSAAGARAARRIGGDSIAVSRRASISSRTRLPPARARTRCRFARSHLSRARDAAPAAARLCTTPSAIPISQS